jgi:hypothetical protein
VRGVATLKDHRGWLAVVVVALAIGATAPWLWNRYAPAHAVSATPARAAVHGSVGTPVRAEPAPVSRPAPVVAPGECGDAITSLRVLVRRYPSGSVLPDAANRRLTLGLARLHAKCAGARAAEASFRARELTPGLTYLPPGATTTG